MRIINFLMVLCISSCASNTNHTKNNSELLQSGEYFFEKKDMTHSYRVLKKNDSTFEISYIQKKINNSIVYSMKDSSFFTLVSISTNKLRDDKVVFCGRGVDSVFFENKINLLFNRFVEAKFTSQFSNELNLNNLFVFYDKGRYNNLSIIDKNNDSNEFITIYSKPYEPSEKYNIKLDRLIENTAQIGYEYGSFNKLLSEFVLIGYGKDSSCLNTIAGGWCYNKIGFISKSDFDSKLFFSE